MDTQIQRMPAPKQIWQHINGAYYFVIAVANTEHRHDDHPPQVVYRSMRQDNGEPSHWWTRNLADWHAKMRYVAEFVPAEGLKDIYQLFWPPTSPSAYPHPIAQDPPPPPNEKHVFEGAYGRLKYAVGYGADKMKLEIIFAREDLPDEINLDELVRVIFQRTTRGLPPHSPAELCAATATGQHSIGPHGPRKQMQCLYCGEPG